MQTKWDLRAIVCSYSTYFTCSTSMLCEDQYVMTDKSATQNQVPWRTQIFAGRTPFGTMVAALEAAASLQKALGYRGGPHLALLAW